MMEGETMVKLCGSLAVSGLALLGGVVCYP